MEEKEIKTHSADKSFKKKSGNEETLKSPQTVRKERNANVLEEFENLSMEKDFGEKKEKVRKNEIRKNCRPKSADFLIPSATSKNNLKVGRSCVSSEVKCLDIANSKFGVTWGRIERPLFQGKNAKENYVSWSEVRPRWFSHEETHDNVLRKCASKVRKCSSSPNIYENLADKCEGRPRSDRGLERFKRSLRLLGFQPSEFGVQADLTSTSTRQSLQATPATLCTKVLGRTVSLDSVKKALRGAWIQDRLDGSQRRLLARAAYEEWYFKKEKELAKSRKRETLIKSEMKENQWKEAEKKKEKAKEEYEKWLLKKKTETKETIRPLGRTSSREIRTKAEAEKAFVCWKKEKDKKIKKKRSEKRREEERKEELEKKKIEKRALAEKVFEQWKNRVNEKEITAKKTRKIKEFAEEIEKEKRKKEEETRFPFEVWKAIKDEEIKRKLKEFRQTAEAARRRKEALIEERLYEAEQAFEEWLDRVEARHQKQFTHEGIYQRTPWLPV